MLEMTGGFDIKRLSMVEFNLDESVGIAVLKPLGPLILSDISSLTETVDNYIDHTGVLSGLLIDATHFPGWKSFAAFQAHLTFIEDHHMKVARVAVVSRSRLFSIFPAIADFFLQSEVKLFHDNDKAMEWLLA
jgi:hypothetical protein